MPLLGGALVCALWTPAEAAACATCSVGDRTLTAMGGGQPFANRLRLSLTGRHRRDRVGTPGVNAIALREQRLELAGAYSPTTRVTISLMLPIVRRDLRFVNLGRDARVSLGDLELRGRFVLYRDRDLAPRHIFSVIAGLEMPTGPARRGQNGQPLPLEFQPGSGSWDPMVGLAYTYFADPFSIYTSLIAIVPTEGRDRSRGGASTRLTALVQWQPLDAFGVRAGTVVRGDARTIEQGAADPDSGGFIAYGAIGLIASPISDLVLQVTVAVPVVQRLNGEHRERVALNAGVAVDL